MNARAKYFQPELLSRIARLELRARHVVEGFVSGLHKSPYKGFSVEFANHRPYVPGDDIRHIDWRVYAKADRFFIKEYEEETNMRVRLLLDASASMAYPEHADGQRMTKWQYAATLAASLAYLLVYQRDAVGLTLFDDEIRHELPGSTNPGTLTTLTTALEQHAPQRRTDLGAVFSRLAGELPRRGLLVILSDLLTDVDDLVRGLQRFRFHRHDVIVLHVLDHDELTFPFADRTLFEGMEMLDQEVLTDPQSLRNSYLVALRAFLRRVETACLDTRVDYALISTAEPLDVALTTFLATRMRRQRAKA